MGIQARGSEQVQGLTLPQLHSASPHFLLCPVDMILTYFMKLLQMCSERHKVLSKNKISFSWDMGRLAI